MSGSCKAKKDHRNPRARKRREGGTGDETKRNQGGRLGRVACATYRVIRGSMERIWIGASRIGLRVMLELYGD